MGRKSGRVAALPRGKKYGSVRTTDGTFYPIKNNEASSAKIVVDQTISFNIGPGGFATDIKKPLSEEGTSYTKKRIGRGNRRMR